MNGSIGQHDDLHDSSFESFIDADAVADAPEETISDLGKPDDSQSGPPLSTAAHHANRLDEETAFFPGGTSSNGDGTSSWSSLGNVGTPTSLPTSLPTTPKIAGHLHTGSASAGRSPVSSWRNLHSFDYDNDLSFNCPYSSAAFGPEQSTVAAEDSEHPDLHSMPGLSYETMPTRHPAPVPPHSFFPSHAFVQPIQDGAPKWTPGLPYGSDMPAMMESDILAASSGILPPQFAGPHRKSFDASQMTALDSSMSAPPTAGLPAHHSMHGRSMSLNMTDAAASHVAGPGMGLAVGTGACSSDDMLNAQAPRMPPAHPFTVKSEPSDAHLPLSGMVGADPGSDMAAGQGNGKKRKVEAETSPTKSKPKSRAREGSPTKKAPRRRPTKSQPVKEEAVASEAVTSNVEANGEAQAAPTAQAEAAAPAGADSNATASGAQLAESESQSSSMDVDKPESADGTSGDSSTASKRKPAQRAKRPPPSASQFTESGKPFPVVDTSATHSTLFVPPDVSGLTRREARLVKNRAAAFLSRQRKREQFEELEKQVGGMSRLVWKMWHTIAGTDAKFDQLAETALQKNIDGEGREMFDYLEQVIVAEGASIAPTEESIANAAAANDGASSSTPAESESNAPSSSTSPGSGSSKPAAGTASKASGSSNSSAQAAIKDKEIASLRAQLEAAQQQAASLQSALVDERTKSSPSSTSGSSSPSSTLFQAVQPGGPLAPFFPRGMHESGKPMGPDGGEDGEGIDSFLSQSEPLFRKGRSEGDGLSLTVAPETQAVREDDVVEDASEMVLDATTQDAQKSQVSTPKAAKRTTVALARAVLVAALGFACANNGATTTTSSGTMPGLEVAGLGADFAGSSMPMGNLFNGTSTSSSDLIMRLAASFSHKGKDEEEADEVKEDNGVEKDNRLALSLPLSEEELLSLGSVGVDWSAMAELVRRLPSVSLAE